MAPGALEGAGNVKPGIAGTVLSPGSWYLR